MLVLHWIVHFRGHINKTITRPRPNTGIPDRGRGQTFGLAVLTLLTVRSRPTDNLARTTKRQNTYQRQLTAHKKEP